MIRSAINSTYSNHVNLIGMTATEPQFLILPGGRKITSFCLSTVETCLDKNGNHSLKQNQHRVIAWGKWAIIAEKCLFKGTQVAIEGKLISREEQLENGGIQTISEIEVNDLVIL